MIAGATIGFLVGRTVTRLDGERPAKKRFVSVGPATDPHGQGIGLGLSRQLVAAQPFAGAP